MNELDIFMELKRTVRCTAKLGVFCEGSTYVFSKGGFRFEFHYKEDYSGCFYVFEDGHHESRYFGTFEAVDPYSYRIYVHRRDVEITGAFLD